jgi:hypothetical protein
MGNQLVLPRKDKDGNYYISYSQINKYKRSKRDYIRSYFFGEDTATEALKKYGAFGHKVGEAYEDNDFSKWNKEEAEFLKGLPHYDEFEREIKLQMDGFYVLGFIDTNTKLEEGFVKHIGDYKTGEIAKRADEYKSDDYEQLDIYGAALEQEFGKLPESAKVILIGRGGNAFKGEELTLTMDVEIIDKEMSLKRMEQVKANVQAVAEEISGLYGSFLKLMGNE